MIVIAMMIYYVYVVVQRSKKLRRQVGHNQRNTATVQNTVVGYTAQGQAVVMLPPSHLPPGMMYMPTVGSNIQLHSVSEKLLPKQSFRNVCSVHV